MAAKLPPPLTDRDRRIMADLLRVRLLTGRQIERLHFHAVTTANARSSARRRTMSRLEAAQLVTTLPRRVGGERAGSAGLVYALDAHALRHPETWQDEAHQSNGRVRRPWSIGWLFVRHTLDVSELYVRLRERERRTGQRLLQYLAEPATWYGLPVIVKPDAYAVFDAGEWEQHRWIEVDRATESLPIIQRKFASYLQLAASGDRGPSGVLPRVLVTVPNDHRLEQMRNVLARQPSPADSLISIERFEDAFAETARPPP